MRFQIVFAGFLALMTGSAGALAQAPLALDTSKLKLASANVLVLDTTANRPIYAKAAEEVTPIASLTKLMTAIVTLDSGLSLDDPIAIDSDDFDTLKGTHSRLRPGAQLPRSEMLRLALMSSENRAASSLARHYPGGMPAFVAAMNAKARSLGMNNTRFEDPTGLTAKNVSTARDLAILVSTASQYPLIRDYSTQPSHFVDIRSTGQVLGFNNTNGLVRSKDWDIQVSKTGFISEAGKCLVMMATIASRPVVIVLLDSLGRYTRVADAIRVKHWMETGEGMPVQTARVSKGGKAGSKKAPVKVASLSSTKAGKARGA